MRITYRPAVQFINVADEHAPPSISVVAHEVCLQVEWHVSVSVLCILSEIRRSPSLALEDASLVEMPPLLFFAFTHRFSCDTEHNTRHRSDRRKVPEWC